MNLTPSFLAPNRARPSSIGLFGLCRLAMFLTGGFGVYFGVTTQVASAQSSFQVGSPTAPGNIASPVVNALFKRYGLDSVGASVWVGPLHSARVASTQPPPAWISHWSETPRNPASVMKLATTAAALDVLGPDHTWSTRIFADGPLQNGTLNGNLVVVGSGDPKLVVERLEPMMRALRDAGVNHVQGDIVLDRSAFQAPELDPSAFDGESKRPYNARPDPLLINFKALVMTFTPDPAAGVARVKIDPPLAGMPFPTHVPLGRGPCPHWRASLRADLDNPNRVSFAGHYPENCVEGVWPVAYSDPASHSARALVAMWHQVGGTLSGQARSGTLPLALRAAAPLVDHASLPYGEIMRDVNKFSNNVMAQHVFFRLAQIDAGQVRPPSATSTHLTPTLTEAKTALTAWWQKSLASSAPPVLDNGSGLSRSERLSASAIKDLLRFMAQHRHASAFFDSLPLAGVDGTLGALTGSRMQGRASLKTGSLQDATSLAGRVQGPDGQWLAFVAMYNGPQAGRARLAFYCLLEHVSYGPTSTRESTPGASLCKL